MTPQKTSNSNSECLVRFSDLSINTEQPNTVTNPYRLFFTKVTVDSQRDDAFIKAIKPKKTLYFSELQETLSSSTKSGQMSSMKAGLIVGSHPQATIEGTSVKTIEETTGSEKK